MAKQIWTPVSVLALHRVTTVNCAFFVQEHQAEWCAILDRDHTCSWTIVISLALVVDHFLFCNRKLMIWVKITPAHNSFNLGRSIPRLGIGVPEVIYPMCPASYPNMVLDCWDNTWMVTRSSLIPMNSKSSIGPAPMLIGYLADAFLKMSLLFDTL